MPATTSRPRQTGLREHWSRLRRQYAIEGYLRGIGSQALSRVRPARSGDSWDDRAMLEAINTLAPRFKIVPSEGLTAHSHRLRDELQAGRPLAELVSSAFALVREASRRVYGLYHHDVQILAGLAMCRGAIAEMATGEGKTLVQSLVAYTWSLHGKGVHVATANSYLAERDQEASVELFKLLGVSSALLPEQAPGPEKRIAYAADVTFGTGTEFGFDYLRDQLERFRIPGPRLGERFARAVLELPPAEQAVFAQRGLHYAILDEADSILIDEAATPLVIATRESGPHRRPAPFFVARDLVPHLRESQDYLPGTDSRPPRLTEAGEKRISSGEFEVPWQDLNRPWKRYVENALSARYRFYRDVHYVIHEGKVVIIDEFTGRARAESSWKDGLHQAVEAKEELEVQSESQSAAGISRQRFYRLYENLCGMTGTAMDSAGELWEVFHRPVVSIPRNKPSQAVELAPRVFTNETAKINAIVADIASRRRQGQPVLVGTRTIGNSEKLSAALTAAGVEHRILNARQDAEEAAIIAEAGEPGAVTIATNMAGRGTHIHLGEGVAASGGLHVIALEIEESRRIDLQLTGRTARQGQPGSHQTFFSADDFVIRRYLPAEAERLAAMRGNNHGELPARWESVFRQAQARAEKTRYESRQGLLRHDDWLSETKRRL